MPKSTPWYQALLRQMLRGFQEIGVQADGHAGLLPEQELKDWCRTRKVDVVFEMNRWRDALPGLPKAIRHVAWIVDFHGRELQSQSGSDILYLFGPRWLRSPLPPAGMVKWFGPGACLHDYHPQRGEYVCDGAFVGHMPRPWSVEELARGVVAGGGLSFGELAGELEALYEDRRHKLIVPGDYLGLADEVCRRRTGRPLQADESVRYDLSGRLVRILNRRSLIDRLLGLNGMAGFHLHGPENWREWAAYADSYRGFLHTPEDMRRVYSGSRINFHEGNSWHFRTADCLASGGLLFIREREDDEWTGGIRTLLEPHVHFVPFNHENLQEQFDRYRLDERAAGRMREAARTVIEERHSWRHRAQEVLSDLRQV